MKVDSQWEAHRLPKISAYLLRLSSVKIDLNQNVEYTICSINYDGNRLKSTYFRLKSIATDFIRLFCFKIVDSHDSHHPIDSCRLSVSCIPVQK